jgi:hypothetical protein
MASTDIHRIKKKTAQTFTLSWPETDKTSEGTRITESFDYGELTQAQLQFTADPNAEQRVILYTLFLEPSNSSDSDWDAVEWVEAAEAHRTLRESLQRHNAYELQKLKASEGATSSEDIERDTAQAKRVLVMFAPFVVPSPRSDTDCCE